MLSFRFPLLVYLALVFVAPAVAGPPVRVSGFVDELRPSLKVSGHDIVGFMRLIEDMTPDPDEVSVWLDGRHEQLCISAQTVDGYYETTAEFDISATEAGVYALELKSQESQESKKKFDANKREIFSDYSAEELVLRGRVGPDCTNYDELYEVPMTWGCIGPGCKEPKTLMDTPATRESQGQDIRSYVVYLNSDGLDAKIVIPKTGRHNEAAFFPCSDVVTGREPRSYEKKCVINFQDDLDETRARVDFFYYGETQEPLPLTLKFLKSD